MNHIINSIQSLFQGMSHWEWAVVISVCVFCAIVNRIGLFFGLAFVALFAWVIRDLSLRASLDASHQMAVVYVAIAGVGYGIYVVYHSVRGA